MTKSYKFRISLHNNGYAHLKKKNIKPDFNGPFHVVLRTKKKGFFIYVGRNMKKSGVFKQPKVFQFNNEPEFKRDVKKLIRRRNVGVGRAAAKFKYTYIALVKLFNKQFTKKFFEPMNAQDIQDNNEKYLFI